MNSITIEKKFWKPKKSDPSQTMLSIKDTAGNWYGIFDVTLGKKLDEYNEGDTITVAITEKGQWKNIVALGDGDEAAPPVTSPSASPAPASNGGNGMTPEKWAEKDLMKQRSIEYQDAMKVGVRYLRDCNPSELVRDEISDLIYQNLKIRLVDGLSLISKGQGRGKAKKASPAPPAAPQAPSEEDLPPEVHDLNDVFPADEMEVEEFMAQSVDKQRIQLMDMAGKMSKGVDATFKALKKKVDVAFKKQDPDIIKDIYQKSTAYVAGMEK